MCAEHVVQNIYDNPAENSIHQDGDNGTECGKEEIHKY
jgi:hypothetical protein